MNRVTPGVLGWEDRDLPGNVSEVFCPICGKPDLGPEPLPEGVLYAGFETVGLTRKTSPRKARPMLEAMLALRQAVAFCHMEGAHPIEAMARGLEPTGADGDLDVYLRRVGLIR